MAIPVVVMDEAGHTGENLLDIDQPVYALAAIRIDRSTAEAAVTAALSRAQTTTELKFSKLRKSNVGRKNVLTLLQDVGLTGDAAAVIVLHKPWMVAAKLVDELVEPRMLARGLQPAWYAGGAAKSMAQALYELGPRALGATYRDMASSFVAMVRSYTPDAGATFVRALHRCKIACRDEQLHDLLSVMIDTPEQMAAEFAGRQDALDPALTSLFWQGGHWSSTLQTRFEVLHDESRSVQRWQEAMFSGIQRRIADQTSPESFTLGEITVHLPTLLETISFGASHHDPRIQVADLLAGASAHTYAVITGARRDEGDFANALLRAGVGDLIKEAVGPSLDEES